MSKLLSSSTASLRSFAKNTITPTLAFQPKANFSTFFKPSKRLFYTYNTNSLPILNSLIARVGGLKSLPLADTAVIYIHHALHSSLPILHAQFAMGLLPENTFVLDKHYSECKAVVEETEKLGVHYQPCSQQVGLGKFYLSFTRDINYLWHTVTEKLKPSAVANLIIMDHGGHALAFAPSDILQKYNVIGIEKTTGGLINPNTQGLPFPIIEVASCAAKKILESPLIAEAVVNKLTPLIPIARNELTCGVVGYGAIGRAIVTKLVSMGHKVIVYDQDPLQTKGIKNAFVTNELYAVVASADYIFGCTGRDISVSIDLFRLCTRNKTLISCSSEDKEFLSLLQLVQRKKNGKVATKPLNDITYHSDIGADIRILRGGFPINFNESGESVPPNDIQLTRALVLAGGLQARRFCNIQSLMQAGGGYMLDPKVQKFIVNEWLKYQPPGRFPEKLIAQFQDEDWIAENSGGSRTPYSVLDDEPTLSVGLR